MYTTNSILVYWRGPVPSTERGHLGRRGIALSKPACGWRKKESKSHQDDHIIMPPFPEKFPLENQCLTEGWLVGCQHHPSSDECAVAPRRTVGTSRLPGKRDPWSRDERCWPLHGRTWHAWKASS